MSYFMEVDLHGHTKESAKQKLTAVFKTLPKDVREITVIHGYHGGTALKEVVKNFSNAKIERKIVGMNPGSTVFIIKKNR